MVDNSIRLDYDGKDHHDSRTIHDKAVCLNKAAEYGQYPLDGGQNRLIFGDNLQALTLLAQDSTVRGKVNLIYIDPPFATNQEFKSGDRRTSTISFSSSDENAYTDRLTGAAFIEFLRKRLILLRELLSDTGSIYLHIDGKMGHYVKVLMDEVFGMERFINDITRIKCNPKNFKRKAYGNIKDMIFFYSKTDRYTWNEPQEGMPEEDIRRLFPKIDTNGRRYTTNPLHAPGETRNGPTGQAWRNLTPPQGRHWRYPPAELDRLDAEGLIEWSATGNPRKIIYADTVAQKGKKRQDVWYFKDPPYPNYPTEKNLAMLKVIIEASSNPGDIVLDCFAGSGTTLIAAENLGRRWIGIDNSRVAITAVQKRLQSLDRLPTYSLYQIEEIINE